jgi:hypothetical protein
MDLNSFVWTQAELLSLDAKETNGLNVQNCSKSEQLRIQAGAVGQLDTTTGLVPGRAAHSFD